MDFGSIGKSLGAANLGANLNPQDILKSYASSSGLGLSIDDIKSVLSSPSIKQALITAISTLAMKKLGTFGAAQQTSVNQNLGQVAGALLEKAPDSGMSKQDVAKGLQDQIEQKLGL